MDEWTSTQTHLQETFVALMVLSSLLVVIRLYARSVSDSGWWWDDGLVLLAWAFVISTTSVFTSEISLGLGRSVHELHNPVSAFLHRNFVGECLLHPSLATIKLVVLYFYARIFSDKIHRRWLIGVGLINILWLVGTGIPLLFSCVPLKKTWLKSAVPYGHCLDFSKYLLGQSTANTLIDFALLALPVAFVWKLNMSVTQRVAFSAVFCVGIFETAVSIARLVVFKNIQYDDISLDYVPPAKWSVVEINVGLMCCCIMAFGPLLKLVRQRYFTYNEPSGYNHRKYGLASIRSRHAKINSNDHHTDDLTTLRDNRRQTVESLEEAYVGASIKDPASDRSAVSLDDLTPVKMATIGTKPTLY